MLDALSAIPTAYATASGGMHASHTLPAKLRALAAAGFRLAEVAFPDLEAHAAAQHAGYQKLDAAGAGDLDVLVRVAGEVKRMAEDLHVRVLTVMPFAEYEGYEDEATMTRNLSRARAWFKVLHALGCSILQVGSSDDASTSGSLEKRAADLQRLADAAAEEKPVIQIAYEPWAWGVHANTWQDCWATVQAVDRPNFGLCLDTFQICARAYADPTAEGGVLADGQERLTLSLSELTRTFTNPTAREKIVYLQVSDGSRHVSPSELREAAAAAPNATTGTHGIDPLYAWSNAWRPLPAEGLIASHALAMLGGHLPVLDVLVALMSTGWRGPWSYEVFYAPGADGMEVEGEETCEKWTKAARMCHDGLVFELRKRLGLRDVEPDLV